MMSSQSNDQWDLHRDMKHNGFFQDLFEETTVHEGGRGDEKHYNKNDSSPVETSHFSDSKSTSGSLQV